MIDAHAHVHDEKFDKDRRAVMRRAFDVGVNRMIMVGTDVKESRKAIKLSERHDNVWASIGIHPHVYSEQRIGYSEQPKMQMQELDVLIQNPKVVAIGEIGLDYYSHAGNPVTEKQKELQKEGFIAQVELAKKHNLPIIIHTRPSLEVPDDAYKDLHSLLTAYCSMLSVVILHCYQGDTEITKKFLAIPNIYFSFAGNITYPVKKLAQNTKYDIRETVRLVPENRLLVETDCPYLAPQPLRGRRNEPAFVRYTLEAVAQIKQADVQALEARIEKNFKEVFKIEL